MNGTLNDYDVRLFLRHLVSVLCLCIWLTRLVNNAAAYPVSDFLTNDTLDEDIHVNQIGLDVDQLKEVVVTGELPAGTSFQVLDERGKVVYQSSLKYSGFDLDSGDELWKGDFTVFRSAGTYRIHLANRGSSYSFKIGKDANRAVATLAARWFYLQRSGLEIKDPKTGVYHRVDHVAPAVLRNAEGHPVKCCYDTSGGWWDAGDYGRYVPTAAASVMSLIYAYRFNPKLFADGSLDIPESGNRIPDLLDEINWELTWLLKMQRPDGAVHHKTATREYAEVRPGFDQQPVYLFDVTTQSTAQFAGVLAEASLDFRGFDPKSADQFLRAAKRAWRWLESNPNKYPVDGFKNPDDPNGGDYSISGDETQQLLWAAAALFHATGEKRYENAFNKLWLKRDKSARVYGLSWADGYVFAMFAYLAQPRANSMVQAEIKQVIQEQTQNILQVINSSGYGVALTGNRPPFGYGWGSNTVALNYATYLLLANRISPRSNLVNGAAAQLNWILGVNPMNKAYITGAGGNPIRYPHHMLSIVRGSAVPGAIGEGPNAMHIGGDPVLARLFELNVPFAKRYADDSDSWATNEPTIDANAAFVAVVAWFSR